MKAPFPYSGGKSRIAHVVWERFGNVQNFVEPFMGSAAVLLRRPDEHFAGGYRVETANDANHFIANFWRAVAAEPDKVAEYADGSVLEADLHARHKWLVRSEYAEGWRKKMVEDPHHYDAKVAGWWVWGACCWIGGAWCHDGFVDRNQRPGMNADGLGNGVHRATQGRPQLTDAVTRVNQETQAARASANGFIDTNLSGASTCDARRTWLVDWMRRLQDRLRLVRTCYGHWARVCDSESTMTRLGLTGVFLDPPYPTHQKDGKKSRDGELYATDKGADLNALRDEVLAWCRRWGQDKQVRIAVCGYEGDGYEALLSEGWEEFSWEATGGYGNQRKAGKGKAGNAKRERIWFSPHCVPEPHTPSLFDNLSD